MSRRLIVAGALLLALAFTADRAAEPDGVEKQDRVEVVQVADSPVQILERKTRIADPESLNERARQSNSGMYERKGWGATERQFVFDVVFRNETSQEILAAEFLCEAFDASGELIESRILSYHEQPVLPGRVEALHEVGLAVVGGVARYRLSTRAALLADGSLWTSPPPPRSVAAVSTDP